MPPITTTDTGTLITQFPTTFKSLIDFSFLHQIATQLGISPTLLGILIAVLAVPMIIFMIWRVTGSFILGTVISLGVVIFLTVTGIIPVQICIVFGMMTLLLLIRNISYIGDKVTTETSSKVIDKIEEKKKEYTWKVDDKYPYKQILIIKEIEANQKSREDIIDMTNQLVQDPKKLKIALTRLQQQQVINGQVINTTITATADLNFTHKVINQLDFDSISFSRGTKILAKLNDSHNQILSVFSNNTNDSLINIDKMKSLELDIYNQGINVLKQVYEIAQQLQQSKVDELNAIHDELSKKLETLDKASPMYNLTSDRLDINSKSLGMIKKYNDRIDELLCQVELFTDNISEMCLELPELWS
jgi:hypothetical protein